MKTQNILNMKPGTRFYWEGHSSIMIATSIVIKSVVEGDKRLCVSENGMAEFLEAHDAYVVPRDFKDRIIKISIEAVEYLVRRI